MSSKYIVVTEKPSVARAIYKVLRDHKIYATLASAKGHIMSSELPRGFEWGKISPREIFNVKQLDMIIKDKKTYQYLKEIFKSDPGVLVIATDNDSEGELIGYEILKIYKSVRGDAPFYRMRFNSIAPAELWRAWNNLEEDLNWRWVYKALFRQQFDLVTGAAFTRLLTTLARKHGRIRLVSWGSCQTPTLYFVVEREKEIETFKPAKYWYLQAKVQAGLYTLTLNSDRIWNRKAAKDIFNKLKNARNGFVKEYAEREDIIRRPLPIMTDYLLRDIVKISKLSAAKVLDIAEELYSEGYCVTPDTLVILSNGEIREIWELDKNDVDVIGYDTIFKPVKVHRVLSRQAPNQMIKIKTNTNRELIVTPDHPILLISGNKISYVKAQNAKLGDFLIVPKHIKIYRKREFPTVLQLIEDVMSNDEKWRLRIVINKRLIDKLKARLARTIENRGINLNIKYNGGRISFLAKKINVNRANIYRWFSSGRLPYPLIRSLIEDNLLNVNELRDGYEGITLSRGKSIIKLPFYLDKDFAYLMGLVIADGYITNSHLNFSFKPEEKEIFEKILKHYAERYSLHLIKVTDKQLTFTNAKTLNYIFRHLGIKEGFKPHSVYIHPFLLRQPQTFIKALLAGIWDCNGVFHYKSNLHASLLTCSMKLQKQIELLLRQFGICASYIIDKRTGKLGVKVHYNYILKLAELLKPYVKIKIRDLESMIKRYRRFSENRKFKSSTSLTPNIVPIEANKDPIVKVGDEVEAPSQNLKIACKIKHSGWTLEQIKKIESIPSPYNIVYDLTTSSSNFLANGILVHNCSYPRTETDKYPKNFDFNIPYIATLQSDISEEVGKYAFRKANPRNGRHDDKAHPPIYPIKPYPRDNSNKWLIWEYIARRFIANAFCNDAKMLNQKMIITIEGIDFHTTGRYFLDEGFYKIFSYFKPSERPLPRVSRGTEVSVLEISLKEGRTQPPSRLSESDLLAMMARSGIGTDATRATFPKIILDRGYAVKRRGKFIPTVLGKKFIESLENINKQLVTPETRRFVEELMKKIEKGDVIIDDAFKKAIDKYKRLFEECLSNINVIGDKLAEGVIDLNREKTAKFRGKST